MSYRPKYSGAFLQKAIENDAKARAEAENETQTPASACIGGLSVLLERLKAEMGLRRDLYEKMGYTTTAHDQRNRGYQDAINDVERWLQEDR